MDVQKKNHCRKVLVVYMQIMSNVNQIEHVVAEILLFNHDMLCGLYMTEPMAEALCGLKVLNHVRMT